ncbi:hypothetical protein OSB04_009788 [Centaurea solstitialis]|uniref:Uncharacterized protein n=1 Tax=Centaurea solstitialis TaxID=347529 RepID=A0AA38T7Y7_9ASTR|nr:hypothetical protein OSB04_009788 [Centaurea solstitialis]
MCYFTHSQLVELEPPTNLHPSNKGKFPTRSKPKPWKPTEKVELAKSWAETTDDFITDKFWDTVRESFEKRTRCTPNYRTVHQITSKVKSLNANVASSRTRMRPKTMTTVRDPSVETRRNVCRRPPWRADLEIHERNSLTRQRDATLLKRDTSICEVDREARKASEMRKDCWFYISSHRDLKREKSFFSMRGGEKTQGAGQSKFHRKSNSVHDQTQAISTTFFVSNLPDGINKRCLWDAVIKVGTVVDTFIASKKGKNGRNFGFVRFIKIQNVKDVEKKLGEIIINGNRIVANVAKFERKTPNSYNRTNNPNPSAYRNLDENVHSKNFGGRRSYAEVLSNNNFQGGLPINRTITVHLPFKSEASSFRNASEVLMGEAKNLQVLENIMDLLKAEGIDDCSVQYTGGLSFIISFGLSLSADNFLLNHKSSWTHWFSWLRKYHKNPRSSKKAVWINLMGLPPHLWSESNALRILGRFGRVLIPAFCDRNTPDLSCYKACLLRLDEKIEVVWNGFVYTLWINEIFEPWSPDFTFESEPDEEISEVEISTEEEDKVWEEVASKDIPTNNNQTPTEDVAEGQREEEKSPMNSVIGETDLGKENSFIQSLPWILMLVELIKLNPRPNGGEGSNADQMLNSDPAVINGPPICSLPPKPASHPIPAKPTFDLNIPILPLTSEAEPRSVLNNRDRIRTVHRQCLKSSVFGNSSRYVERGRLERNKSLTNRRSKSGSSLRVPLTSLSREEGSENEQSVEKEVQETINLGNQIGFQMDGFESEVREYNGECQCSPMNYLSINIRGIGGCQKIGWIRKLQRIHNLKFIAIQETQFSNPERIKVSDLWNSSSFDFETVASQGRSGGLISLWDSSTFVKSGCLKGTNFLITIGNLKGIASPIFIANIYAPRLASARQALWNELLQIIQSNSGAWVLMGDYNEIRNKEERIGSSFSHSAANIFNSFISESGLSEINLGGRRYTWMGEGGTSLSKLDRFLVSSDFLVSSPSASATVLAREYSDHFPIILSCVGSDFGPIPFRFFNSWVLHKDFNSIVANAWNSCSFRGKADRSLAFKLKAVKRALKAWKAEVIDKDRRKIEGLKEKLDKSDKAAEVRPLSTQELEERRAWKKEILDLEYAKSLDLKQKARIRWAVDGDENSSFFHGMLNSNKNRNRINGLSINAMWVNDPATIKEETFKFFSQKFKETMYVRPKFVSNLFNKVSNEDNIMLVAPFSADEIKGAVWDCGSEKAPGPDGFTFKFLKHCWEIIKEDVISLVRQFEREGKFSDGCNPSFISLFPKVNDPLSLRDYRPISLIGCIYKIIAKLLTGRLKKVVGKVVSMEQSAYVEGRQILDGPLMVNEVCSWAKRSKSRVFLFKVDFEKAFDFISWNYLDSILEQMHFGVKWRSWIKGCLNSARASVLVNSSPTSEFPLSRGLRQGDPLSPFLFIIAMEGLHVAMLEATRKNLFNGIRLPNNGPMLSHLLFADDVMFLGKWTDLNAINLKWILNCFHLVSGLKVNFSKSKVFGIGVQDNAIGNVASLLKCAHAKLPFNYMGITIGANMGVAKNWKCILEKIDAKLSLWKAKNLSFGGRVTLCKSVLGSIPLYYMSLYRAPQNIIDAIDKLRRRFIWGVSSSGKSKICWVDWTKTTAPKQLGGLGIGSLKSANIALLIKWIWRFRTCGDALWTKVIKATHGLSGCESSVLAKPRCAGTRLNIVKTGSSLSSLNLNLDDFLSRKIRNGIETKFWSDRWIGNSPLKFLFPELFDLERDKSCSIAMRFSHSTNETAAWTWSWSNNSDAERLSDKVEELEHMLKNVVLMEGDDKWSWEGDPSGDYTVSSLRGIIDGLSCPPAEYRCFWNNWLPPRVNCFIWRLLSNRIPTRVNLNKRGINTSSTFCPLCESEEETVEHLFHSCSAVKDLWRWFFDWCLINVGQQASFNQFLFKILECGKSLKSRKFLEAAVGGLVWFIWKARNNLIFKGVKFSASMVKDEFQATLFSWMKYRANCKFLLWSLWCSCPSFSFC